LLIETKLVLEIMTIVKSGVNDGCSYGTGYFRIKVDGAQREG